MTEHWKGVSLIKLGWHNKPPLTWNLQTGHSRQKLFQNCCNSKAPMTVRWNSWGFYNCDILLQFLPNLIWAPSSLPYHFLFERWLEKHNDPTQTLPLGCGPFIHKWHWSHKRPPTTFHKKRHGLGVQALSRTKRVLTLLRVAQLHFMAQLYFMSYQAGVGAQPRAGFEELASWEEARKTREVSVLLSLVCFKVWAELTFTRTWNTYFPP